MPDVSEQALVEAQYPQPRPDVSTFALDEELILCSDTNPTVFALNQTGALVWALCNGERSVGCIARTFARSLGLDDAQALEDVTELTTQLELAGLLTVTARAGARFAPDPDEPVDEGWRPSGE